MTLCQGSTVTSSHLCKIRQNLAKEQRVSHFLSHKNVQFGLSIESSAIAETEALKFDVKVFVRARIIGLFHRTEKTIFDRTKTT